MKKVALFIIFLGLLSISAKAQRCLPGQIGIQVKAGLVDGFQFNPYATDFGYYVEVNTAIYTRFKSHWEAGVAYLEKRYPYKRGDIPLMQLTAAGGYHFTFLSDRRSIFLLSIGASGIIGYEIVNKGVKETYDGLAIHHHNTFIYGGALALKAEIYLKDSIILLFDVQQRILGGSTISPLRTQFGTGLKFIIH